MALAIRRTPQRATPATGTKIAAIIFNVSASMPLEDHVLSWLSMDRSCRAHLPIMTSVLIAALSTLGSGCSYRAVNRVALGASLASLACDWAQTRAYSMSGWAEDSTETNPVLGPAPTPQRIDVYFASMAILTSIVWAVVPRRLDILVPVAVVAVQAGPVLRTARLPGSNPGLCATGLSIR